MAHQEQNPAGEAQNTTQNTEPAAPDSLPGLSPDERVTEIL